MEYKMTGAELASQLKGQLGSNMKFNGIDGVDDPSLHLSEDDIKWWRNAKFGMFIHWGVYSLIEKGEWAYFNEGIPEEEYREIARNEFKPDMSAEDIMAQWTDAAIDAGMKYAVMVTRHHDGYALWDSKCSWKDFTSVRCGSGEDYVKAFTDACHAKKLYTGLYYSPMDWRFPGYFDPEGKKDNLYLMKEQGYGQIKELCANYGKVDILWYDGGWLAHKGTDADAAWFWEPVKLNKTVRSYNPKIMVTPRSGYRGDFECDEGPHEIKGRIVPIPWEKNMSLTSSWAYRPNNRAWPAEYIIKMLVDAVCRDGNLLLNMAPDANGRIPENSLRILKEIGLWLKENGEAIYKTRAGMWQPVDNVYGSAKTDEAQYIHIFDCEKFNTLTLPPTDKIISRAVILNGNDVEFSQTDSYVKIIVPTEISALNKVDTIIKITFDTQKT